MSKTDNQPVPESRKIILELAEIRKKKKISLPRLADLAGVKGRNLYTALTGQRSTGIDSVYKIAFALGYEIRLVKIRKKKHLNK